MKLWNSWALILTFPLLAASNPVRFDIKDLTQRNLLAVVSDAPLEKMIAQCHLFHGWVEVDPQDLKAGIRGELELDTRSCETGSGIRDLVLQEKVLDVKQYPLAKVQIKKWVKEAIEVSVDYRGKTTSLEIPLKVVFFPEGEKTKGRLPGNLLRISSQSELGLPAIGISVPEEMKQTLSSKVELIFDAVGTSKLPNDKILLPEGPKPKERG